MRSSMVPGKSVPLPLRNKQFMERDEILSTRGPVCAQLHNTVSKLIPA